MTDGGARTVSLASATAADIPSLLGYAAVALGFSLEFGGRSAFLDELYVRPSSRGLGIGTLALHLLQEACRGLGARSLALEVGLGNAGATGLYRREGFSTIGRQLMTRRL